MENRTAFARPFFSTARFAGVMPASTRVAPQMSPTIPGATPPGASSTRRWQDQVSQTPLYQALAEWAGDPYVVFGCLGAFSFLAIGLALLPDMRRAGVGGRLFAWLIIVGAVVTVISYLGTPVDSPLHPLWGAEGYWLILVGLASIVATFTAGCTWRTWTRILLGLSLPVLVAGTVTLQYYPHGSLVALALESVALIVAAPREARTWSAETAPDRGHP